MLRLGCVNGVSSRGLDRIEHRQSIINLHGMAGMGAPAPNQSGWLHRHQSKACKRAGRRAGPLPAATAPSPPIPRSTHRLVRAAATARSQLPRGSRLDFRAKGSAQGLRRDHLLLLVVRWGWRQVAVQMHPSHQVLHPWVARREGHMVQLLGLRCSGRGSGGSRSPRRGRARARRRRLTAAAGAAAVGGGGPCRHRRVAGVPSDFDGVHGRAAGWPGGRTRPDRWAAARWAV